MFINVFKVVLIVSLLKTKMIGTFSKTFPKSRDVQVPLLATPLRTPMCVFSFLDFNGNTGRRVSTTK